MFAPILAITLCAATAAQESHLRIIDAETRKPIQGARVDRVPEVAVPMWGEYWFTARGESDVEGLVTLPPRKPKARDSWLVVTADGYAPFGAKN